MNALERALLVAIALHATACASAVAAQPGARPAAPPVAAAPAPLPSLDAEAIAAATGGKPEKSDAVLKVSFPRGDVPVEIDGWTMPPFMGLTSWVAFTAGGKPGVEAMIMGDLVLFEDEVNPTMSAAFAHGLEVTALHNHFFYDRPRVYFVHVGGEGTVAALGKGVRAALDAVADVRKKAAKPAATFGAPVPAKNAIDGAKLEAVLGTKGQAKDGMFKAVMGRKTTASCGCTVGKAMGVNTWAAFAGTDDDAVVDGDFAVLETELQPVLRALRAGGVNIVAIHHHMSGESPRILFLHYWGRGRAVDLAGVVKRALDLTAWDGRGG